MPSFASAVDGLLNPSCPWRGVGSTASQQTKFGCWDMGEKAIHRRPGLWRRSVIGPRGRQGWEKCGKLITVSRRFSRVSQASQRCLLVHFAELISDRIRIQSGSNWEQNDGYASVIHSSIALSPWRRGWCALAHAFASASAFATVLEAQSGWPGL